MYQSVAKEELKQRRKQLRRKRRLKVAQALWRFGWMGGIVAGVAWTFSQPSWKITKPEQVEIVGNRYLTDATIRSLLPIRYPQWLVQLEPDKIKQKLLQQGGIVDVDVDRGLFPPHLTIRIDEHPPVAMAILPAQPDLPQGFVYRSGKVTPVDLYSSSDLPVPKLKIMLPSGGSCLHWEQIYSAIQTSPVAIGVIDCRHSQNLILQTEVGKVRLGSYLHEQRLAAQMQQLDRLRNWQKSTDPQEVNYLDLENPDFPKLQLKQAGTTKLIRT